MELLQISYQEVSQWNEMNKKKGSVQHFCVK